MLAMSFIGEFVFEAVKFVIMILLFAVAFVLGGKLRKAKDAKKSAKEAIETK